MHSVQQLRRDREYEVKFTTCDTVVADEMEVESEQLDDRHEGGNQSTVDQLTAVYDIATFAVQRLLAGGGLHTFDVDVTDENGVTWPLTVYCWRGKWVCERRGAERSSLSGDAKEQALPARELGRRGIR